MNPYVRQVVPLDGYRLELLFETGERRVFDVKPSRTHCRMACSEPAPPTPGLREALPLIAWEITSALMGVPRL